MYQALQNVPIQVNLLTAANDTGWTQANGTANHSSCNVGFCTLIVYPVLAGNTYQFTYSTPTLSSGYLAVFIGGTEGVHRTAPDIYVETLIAAADGFVKFYATGNCSVTGFNIKNLTVDDGVTWVWSAINKNWSDRRTLYPEFGASVYVRTILMKDGAMYAQQNGSDNRNNFFGVQYQSSIKFVENKNCEIVKGYQSINYIAGQLMITTEDGITTPLGQVSSLIDTDFLRGVLTDASLTVTLYASDGVYAANFLMDSNEDINTGSPLKGSYLICELTTTDGSIPLRLYSVEVQYAIVKIGSR